MNKIIDRKAALYSLLIVIVLFGYILVYTGQNVGGNLNWLPLESGIFGVPEVVRSELDITPIYGQDSGYHGWDGQFYYYMSNDILGMKDTAEHIDSPSYRYQRIGLPLIARVFSYLLFQKNVSVLVYVIANLIIIFLALYVFFVFLKRRNASWLWVFPWCLSTGVIITLRHLLPDAAADAWIIISLIALLDRRYLCYVIFMTLGCLTREGYEAIAFFVFLFGFLGILEKKKRFNLKFAALLAIPGIVFVLWYGYVTIHFGALPFTQANQITQFFLSAWPKWFMTAAEKKSSTEFVGLLIYILLIFIALGVVYIQGKNDKRYWCLAPYIFLLGSFGDTVMMNYSGYLKAISVLYAMIIIILADAGYLSKKFFCRYNIYSFSFLAFMLISVVFSFSCINKFQLNLINLHFNPSNRYVLQDDNSRLTDFNSIIKVNVIETQPYISHRFLKPITKKYSVAKVEVTNLSDQIWSYQAKEDGRYAINIGYHWLTKDDKSVVKEGRSSIGSTNIEPGETRELELYLEYPEKPGEYILRISMVQEGEAWFFDKGIPCYEQAFIVEDNTITECKEEGIEE